MNEIECHVVMTSWWTDFNIVDVTFDLDAGPITIYLQLLMEVVPAEKIQ